MPFTARFVCLSRLDHGADLTVSVLSSVCHGFAVLSAFALIRACNPLPFLPEFVADAGALLDCSHARSHLIRVLCASQQHATAITLLKAGRIALFRFRHSQLVTMHLLPMRFPHSARLGFVFVRLSPRFATLLRSALMSRALTSRLLCS